MSMEILRFSETVNKLNFISERPFQKFILIFSHLLTPHSGSNKKCVTKDKVFKATTAMTLTPPFSVLSSMNFCRLPERIC